MTNFNPQPVAGDPENASTRKIMTFYRCGPEGTHGRG